MRTYAVSRILICIKNLYYADDSSSHKPQLLCSGINRCEERLSLSDYLHEKAAESRHNETQAYLLIIVGVVLFSVGTLETIMATDSPNWFLLIPYCITPSPYHLLGLFFTLVGLTSVISGGILGVKYRLDRGQYLNELKQLLQD